MNFVDKIKFDILKLPVLASDHGKAMDDFIVYIHYLMAVLFLIWIAYFFFVIVRFRKAANPKADYVGVKSQASSWLEVGVAVVEAVLLLGFAIPLWAKVVDAEKFPPEKDSIVIRVTAEQFSWNSRYPGADGKFGRQDIKLVSSENPLGFDKTDPAGKDDVIPPLKDVRVPVGKPVIIHITSKDVIHCFKLLPLRVTQDAIPGMSIPVHFTPTKVGKYQITCAQLCGGGHATMNGGFTVETEEDFKKWLAEKAKSGGAASFE